MRFLSYLSLISAQNLSITMLLSPRNKQPTCTPKPSHAEKPAVCAHAPWLTQLYLSSGEYNPVNVSVYHLIAKNGCLDGQQVKLEGEMHVFKYDPNPSAVEISLLNDLMVSLVGDLKKYYREAAKNVMVREAITHGLLQPNDFRMGYPRLIRALTRLPPHPDRETAHGIDVTMKSSTDRDNVRIIVEEWSITKGIRIEITESMLGLRTGQLVQLTKPQENYSRNAFYAEAVKVAKGVHAYAKKKLMSGSAEVLYQRRNAAAPKNRAALKNIIPLYKLVSPGGSTKRGEYSLVPLQECNKENAVPSAKQDTQDSTECIPLEDLFSQVAGAEDTLLTIRQDHSEGATVEEWFDVLDEDSLDLGTVKVRIIANMRDFIPV